MNKDKERKAIKDTEAKPAEKPASDVKPEAAANVETAAEAEAPAKTKPEVKPEAAEKPASDVKPEVPAKPKADVKPEAAEKPASDSYPESSERPVTAEPAPIGESTDRKKSVMERVRQETRVYDVLNKDTRIFSQHKWIGDDEEPVIKPISSDTLSGINTVIPAPDRRTRISDISVQEKTRRVTVADLERRLLEQELAEEKSRQAAEQAETGQKAGSEAGLGEKLSAMTAGVRSAADSLRRVRIADSRRFGRFLKLIGVFALILLIETGWLMFAAHVRKMPDQVKETQKELELVQKENDLLSEELETLGDHDSMEELKQSWERLKEKVEKAAEETYY